MWKCPVCDQENNAATVCPACGYDRTCDYEQYPTAFAVTTATPTRTLRRQWQEKQSPALADLIADWYDAPQDPAAAEHCFRRLADGGDPAAQYWLGIAYAQGRGAKKDAAQALGWLRKAAQQGHVRAQQKLDAPETQMPDQLFARYQREPDQAKRMEYLKKSAQMGYTPAQAELGDCYAQGRGVKQDYVKASEWYRRAAEQPPQQPEAPQQTETPQQLFERYQQESDQAKRMDYLKKSAETGYAQAQAWMALTYSKGHGVKKNVAEAARWLQRLARQNSPEARYWLGRCYSGGWGVKTNKAQARKSYRESAEQGYAPAQTELGECYCFGRGVEEDDAQAVLWYQKAADQGYAEAQYWLGDCYYYGRGVEEDKTLAVQWYQKAADQGNAWAQYSLGHCYYHGQGVKKDRAQAAQLYQKAAEQGNKDAQLALADCYEQGRGVPKNSSLAREWREKAKNNNG